MQTEGLGGPCPKCGAMNCFIKKGSGTWYTFIACPECYFAYGEHADSMMEETRGVVAGADVWQNLITASPFKEMEEFETFFELGEDDFTVETPFKFEDDFEKAIDLCVVSEHVVKSLVEHKESNLKEV